MSNNKLYKFHKFMMYFWVMLLPITFNWMSPVLIIMAGFEGYISLSLIIFSIWFVSSLFVGRAYCSYGCQWGASQELFSDAIPKALDPKKKRRNRKIKYFVFAFWIIFIILGPLLAGGFINGINIVYPSEPKDLMSLISFNGSSFGQLLFYFGIIGSVAILFSLVGGRRSFCSYACPMAVLGIIATKIKNFLKYPSLHLEADSELCTKCKRCSRECVMSLDVQELVQSGNMHDPDCILCGSCVSTCPQEVISYSWRWRK
ncbi:MAG: 4Fe-4S binding protein [Candidatus Lokiarchaeota archaeon]|nr:4Fe-4S binding protein [Candidatus Lokiarchaeota archaeon]